LTEYWNAWDWGKEFKVMGVHNEQTTLVIGGGPAGIEAARILGQAGYPVVLVEKDNRLGGVLNQLASSFPRWEDPADLVALRVKELEKRLTVKILLESTVTACQKNKQGYQVKIQHNSGAMQEIQAGAVIIATGFEMMDLSGYGEYGHGSFPNVFNSLEFEAVLKEWSAGNKPAKAPVVAFFKCVGSRDRAKGYPYCSKICCMYTAKQAGLVKDLIPEAKSYVFYMDYRASGKEYEEFVRSVIEEKHVRYVRGRPAKVLPEDGRLLIRCEDTLMGVPVEVRADYIVLAAAIRPSRGTTAMAQLFGLKIDAYGFIEPEPFQPVQVEERVFLAGSCGFAVETLGALQQGAAAAAQAMALLKPAD
jgi:heterodisulfide reductase subunit A